MLMRFIKWPMSMIYKPKDPETPSGSFLFSKGVIDIWPMNTADKLKIQCLNIC